LVARFFSIMSFLDQIEPLQQQAVQDFNQASDLTSLDQVRIQYLGASGKFTALLKQLSTLTKEEKPAAGKLVNLAKGE
jgi:phenylalanyl-tRNA synthetase alpha chain